MTEEQRARLKEMAVWLEWGDDGAEGSVMLAASVAQEHSADLSAALATIARLEAERVKDGEALNEIANLDRKPHAPSAPFDAARARLSSRAKDQS